MVKNPPRCIILQFTPFVARSTTFVAFTSRDNRLIRRFTAPTSTVINDQRKSAMVYQEMGDRLPPRPVLEPDYGIPLPDKHFRGT